jgi:hypothetical protein
MLASGTVRQQGTFWHQAPETRMGTTRWRLQPHSLPSPLKQPTAHDGTDNILVKRLAGRLLGVYGP